MLVILVIVEVPRILLHGIVDAQVARIHLLGPQRMRIQLPIDLPPLPTGLALDPDLLDVLAADDIVPVAVRLAPRGLGRRQEVA